MIIRDLELATSRLNELREFYLDYLQLPAGTVSNGFFELRTGPTSTRFVEWAGEGNPFYHFAFNIPENQVEAAKAWLAKRVQLLELDGESLVHFEVYNSHSVYFYDPAGNIVELIARHDLNDASEAEFGSTSIGAVSEIGLPVADVEASAKAISTALGQPVWHKGTLNDTLTFLGQDTGLLIVVKQGRDWLMTTDAAEPWPVRATVEGFTGPYTSADKAYRIESVNPYQNTYYKKFGKFALRGYRPEDAPYLSKHFDNPKIARGLRDQFPSPYTLEAAVQWLATSVDNAFLFAIEIDGEPIGSIGIVPKQAKIGVAELGYLLSEEYWGKGIITDAARHIIEHAFTDHEIDRLEACTYAFNPASARVLQKLGFERDTCAKPTEYKQGKSVETTHFVLTKQNWEANRS